MGYAERTRAIGVWVWKTRRIANYGQTKVKTAYNIWRWCSRSRYSRPATDYSNASVGFSSCGLVALDFCCPEQYSTSMTNRRELVFVFGMYPVDTTKYSCAALESKKTEVLLLVRLKQQQQRRGRPLEFVQKVEYRAMLQRVMDNKYGGWGLKHEHIGCTARDDMHIVVRMYCSETCFSSRYSSRYDITYKTAFSSCCNLPPEHILYIEYSSNYIYL